MNILASFLFCCFWVVFEKGKRKQFQLWPYEREHLKEAFARSQKDPKLKALKAVYFWGICLMTFSIWEGCVLSVIDKNFGLIGFSLGSCCFMFLLWSRIRAYRNQELRGSPFVLRDAILLVLSLFALNGPLAATVLGLGFLLRLLSYFRKYSKLSSLS